MGQVECRVSQDDLAELENADPKGPEGHRAPWDHPANAETQESVKWDGHEFNQEISQKMSTAERGDPGPKGPPGKAGPKGPSGIPGATLIGRKGPSGRAGKESAI
jgi:hypothetical protein